MKNKSDGKFFAKLCLEENFQFGPYDTREECIKKAIKEWNLKDMGYVGEGFFETGKLAGYIPTINWTADNLADQASNEGGYESEYPDLNKEQCEQLDDYMTECLHKWLLENKVDPPNFGLMVDIQKHQLEE